MTLNQLKYVVEVAKAGSINRAAANLFVSQSVLSTTINKLEREIGHAIFTRTNHGVSPTAFGRTFISYVSSIQEQLLQLDHLIYHSTPRHEFTLSIGSTGYYFLDKACAEIYKKYQAMGIRIEEYEDHINNIADMVSNAAAELGIIHLWTCYKSSYVKQIHTKGLQYYPISTLDVAVTVGKNNPLFYAQEDAVPVSALAPYPTIKYTYLDAGPYSDIYSRLRLPDSGNHFVVTSRSTIYETLRNTDAYYLNSIYPLNVLTPDGSDSYAQFRTLRLKDCPIHSEIGWIKRKNHALSSPADEIIGQLTQYFAAPI
jgi:DNA-binding transcriptional LysR family regulator